MSAGRPRGFGEGASHIIELARAAEIRVGPLVIEPALRRISRDDGREAVLEPRVMRVLVALAQAEGRILAREQLLGACWPGVIVGDDALNRVISRVRRLSETLGAGVLRLETITKVGYRLVRIAQAPGKQPAAPHRELGEGPLGNLPRRLTPLIGREVELQQILAQLQSADLVTITGAGGVGKTRLAHEVGQSLAEAFKDGVWLAELAPVTDPAQVPGAVARAMGLGLPAGDEARRTLVERLKARDCLIILDNCEHLIDATAALAAAILEQSSTVKLVATSQEMLRVEGEQVFPLQSLAEADAAQLFFERARAVDASFDPPERSADAIAAICRRLDGIPLAIEMAAVRAPALGCDGLLERLDGRFRLLTGGRRTALPRQRTLIATLDWSHDLLSERDAAVFRRLAVFTGGSTLDAAAEACACERWDSVEVAEAVASLVAKSLLAPETAFGGRRYRLLETTRAYALEKLAAAGETQEIQRAHADYFRRLAARSLADYYLRPVSDDAFAERYFGEVDNFARAIDWAFGPQGDAQAGIALAADAEAVMEARSLYAEFAAWAALAVSRVNTETPAAVRARLLAVQAFAHTAISPARAAELAETAIEACRADGDTLSLYLALFTRAYALANSGQAAGAASVLAEMGAMVDQLPRPSRAVASFRYWLWFSAFVVEPGTTTVDPPDDAIADMRSLGAEGTAILYRCWRLFAYAPGDINEAIEEWHTLLADVRRSHTYGGLTTVLIVGQLMTLLALRRLPGDLDEAIELGHRHARIDVWYEGFHTLAGLAWVALRTDRAALAGRLAGRIGRVSAETGSRSWRRRLFDSLLAALQVELTEAELGALMAEGAGLSAEHARRLVLGD